MNDNLYEEMQEWMEADEQVNLDIINRHEMEMKPEETVVDYLKN